MKSVLVLNATYQPLAIVPIRRAVNLLINDKATSLDGSGQFLHSANSSLELPYVVLLKNAIKQGKMKEPGFSRRGVLVRDNYLCVYCNKTATTIDHVIPRAKGGLSTFANCVASCRPCNSKKADKTLEQMGWTIPKTTRKTPSHLSGLLDRIPTSAPQRSVWENYIFMYEPSLAPAAVALA